MNSYETIDNQSMLSLSIVDTLDWKDEEAHVLRIYEAINNVERMWKKKRLIETAST